MTPVLRGIVDPTSSQDTAAPLLVLGPSLGTTAEMWTAAARMLTPAFRVLRVDLPGHGISPATTEPLTMADLAAGVIALVDSLGGGRFSYAGVSMGGAVGIELATGAAADRLDGLAIIGSNAKIGDSDQWRDRAERVRRQGTAWLVAGSSQRWFDPGFLSREPDLGGRALNDLVDIDDESYARCCEALADFDRRADVGGIRARTLVATGESDGTVPPADAQELADAIPGARFETLPETGHQAHLERPERLAALLRAALPAGRYESGMTVRRAVLGDTWVDASLAGITPETEDFQRFITEYAWGGIWTRPGLERRMRSAVTISSLVTAHHWHELELHLHAGIRNGLRRDELAEILLQTAIYAGVPAANSAFGVAKRVFADLDGATDD